MHHHGESFSFHDCGVLQSYRVLYYKRIDCLRRCPGSTDTRCRNSSRQCSKQPVRQSSGEDCSQEQTDDAFASHIHHISRVYQQSGPVCLLGTIPNLSRGLWIVNGCLQLEDTMSTAERPPIYTLARGLLRKMGRQTSCMSTTMHPMCPSWQKPLHVFASKTGIPGPPIEHHTFHFSRRCPFDSGHMKSV